MFSDDLLPTYDVSDAVAVVVDASPADTWSALMNVDLIEVGRERPMVGILGGVRLLPELASHLLHGELPPAAPERVRLRDTTAAPPEAGGWVLLGDRDGVAIALGLVGKFWRPRIEYAAVEAAGFRDFDEPGYAKTVYELSVHELEDGRTLLRGEMRTATTDEHARSGSGATGRSASARARTCSSTA